MQIEAGKYYRTRDGQKAHVLDDDGSTRPCYVEIDGLGKFWYRRDGRVNINDNSLDIISEWVDEQSDDEPDYAELAAIHGIKITVHVGDVLVEYDGRV